MVVIEPETTTDENHLKYDNPVDKKIKGFVEMKRMSTIRLVPVLR